MEKYSICCTESQTKKALELGAPIDEVCTCVSTNEYYIRDGLFVVATTEDQMIGFILDSCKGYAVDLATLIKEYGYKQDCLTFIDNYLK